MKRSLTLALFLGLFKAPAAACDRARFRIVLDVGHTEQAPGAISARGVTELEFNRRLATVVADRLASDGFATVQINRNEGTGHAELSIGLQS